MTSKIQPPNLSQDKILEILTLHATGATLPEIQQRAGVPYAVVYFYAVLGGVPAPGMDAAEAGRLVAWLGRRGGMGGRA